jgi:hypothetical protein
MNSGNDQIMACLAWGSPHIQNRRSKASVHNVLIPLDEGHLRMWFSPVADLNACDNASLEVFRALQERLITPVWFRPTIFNASVRESLGLELRNQRDRFLLSYYQHMSMDYPEDEGTKAFIWRYVLGSIAQDDQTMYLELWRADFHSQLCASKPTLGTVTDIDEVIVELVEGLPTSTLPATPIFNTSDPTMFDTILLNYAPRRHRMVLATHRQPLATIAQRYAAM